jgi:phage replication O-like protein O
LSKDSFTKIPNDILDALIGYRLPGEERQCLDFIIRKTWGWSKTSDNIAISQFHKATGINKSNIIRALKRLKLKKLIIVGQNDNKTAKSYRINKKYKTWESIAKKSSVSVVKKDKQAMVKKTKDDGKLTNELLVKVPPTKETNKNKKIKERENPPSGFTKRSRSAYQHRNPLTDEEKVRRIEELKRQADALVLEEKQNKLSSQ